jgi:AmmeMemoRadiSam system protein A
MSPLSDEDQRCLLAVARRSIEETAQGRGLPGLESVSGALAERAGAFVTLRGHGVLRGCIGQIEPRQPLARTVAECAASAALHDPRFPPVTPLELPELRIEISVLSPLFDATPEQIVVGRHGLLVSDRFHQGLLLPQVPVEWSWDRERFLSETCRKAGLPPDAWRRGARVQAFTTHVFAEGESRKAASPAGAHRSAEG